MNDDTEEHNEQADEEEAFTYEVSTRASPDALGHTRTRAREKSLKNLSRTPSAFSNRLG